MTTGWDVFHITDQEMLSMDKGDSDRTVATLLHLNSAGEVNLEWDPVSRRMVITPARVEPGKVEIIQTVTSNNTSGASWRQEMMAEFPRQSPLEQLQEIHRRVKVLRHEMQAATRRGDWNHLQALESELRNLLNRGGPNDEVRNSEQEYEAREFNYRRYEEQNRRAERRDLDRETSKPKVEPEDSDDQKLKPRRVVEV